MDEREVLDGDAVLFAGGGRMAAALVGGLCARGWPAERIFVADPSRDARRALEAVLPAANLHETTASLFAGTPGTLVLAVKPQQIEAVLADAAGKEWPLVVSIAAGITTARLEASLLPGTPVVRCMPNTPALVGRGITALAAGQAATSRHLADAEQLLSAVGKVVILPEAQLDAVTAISGSGPAYFFLFMKSLLDTALELGLDPGVAKALVLETAAGAAELARAQHSDYGTMIAAVASKGGTTERALTVFQERDLAGTVRAAALAACARSKELGR